MKKLSIFTVSALITFSAVSSAYAIAGVGFHWGFDYSLSMDGVDDEKVDIPVPNVPDLPSSLQNDLDTKGLINVARNNWRSSAINFGGKAYIDIIPFIEAVEISCNFGLWQYTGSLSYADLSAGGIANAINNNGRLDYKTVTLTPKDKYWGLDGIPYAKLQLDATVRKTLLNLWIVKLSGGAGFSSHFSTPLLTAALVKDVIGSQISDPANLQTLLAPGGKISQDIVQKIKDETLSKPVYGMHILLGVKAKLPVVPIGVYIDGKYMIPFTKFDSDAGDKSVNGFGLLLNAGLSFSI